MDTRKRLLHEWANYVGLNGDTPSPEEAWGQVERMFAMSMAWRDGYAHPLVQQAVQALGGLRRLGQEPMKMTASTRARFCRTYETLLNRQRRDIRMLPDVREAVGALSEGPGNNAAGKIKELAEKLDMGALLGEEA